MGPLLIAAAGVVSTLVLSWLAVRALLRRSLVSERLFAATDEAFEEEADGDESLGWLSRWLFLAGFRRRRAATIFLIATVLLAALGGLFVAGVYATGTLDLLVRLLYAIPGGVGEVFLPVAYASPWLSVALFAFAPALYVRDVRRRRTTMVEQDLPLTLDLLATLAEAGVAFDAALDRVLASQVAGRPLAAELRTFQRDMLAGRARIDSLRRLGWRLSVPWFTIFISAVVQAEQIGASLADVLRTQADDLRERRRERALAFANAIPVKILFPLIVCFLPGLFVVGIGPTFYQIFQAIDGLLAPFQGAAP